MVNPVFSQDEIHRIYLEWMNESHSGSYRKDRFLNMMEGVPRDKQYEIEQWIVSALAIGLEYGHKIKNS